MKKLIEKIKTGATNTAAAIREKNRVAKAALAENRAEGYIDSGVKIIIAVVIGGLLLAGLYALFNTTIIPTLTAKIAELFSYAG